MSVATSTAIIIGAGVAGGVSVYGAHQQAKAAKKAAEQQQQGVREARAYAEPLYEQARSEMGQIFERGQAGLAPYAQQGTQGLYALSDFLGVPRAPVPAAATGAPGAAAPPVPWPAGRTRPPDAPVVGQAVPRGTPAPGGQSSYVTLRAPTGQTQPVPAEHVDYYLARGATRV
jgi:hypothetical protein